METYRDFPASETAMPTTVNLTVRQRQSRRYLTERVGPRQAQARCRGGLGPVAGTQSIPFGSALSASLPPLPVLQGRHILALWL